MKYQNIAPAPQSRDEGSKPRKYTPRSSTQNIDQTQSVLRRNARERNRVKQVNNSFARLRQHIPQSIIADLTKGGGRGPHKKISKVDTLRIAVEYIRRLQDLLDNLNGSSGSGASSGNVSHLLIPNETIESDSEETCESSYMSSEPSTASSTASLNQSPALNDSDDMQVQCSTSINSSTLARTSLPSLLESMGSGPSGLNFGTSTTLLSPVSISSYSPQPQHQHLEAHLDAGVQSPNTSPFNPNSLSFDSGTFDQHQPPQLAPSTSLSAIATSATILPNLANLSTLPTSDLLSVNISATQVNEISSVLQQPNLIGPALTLERIDTHLQLKFEPYNNNFRLPDGDCTPDDEELLDYISLWQDH